jgi:hypothetical protein
MPAINQARGETKLKASEDILSAFLRPIQPSNEEGVIVGSQNIVVFIANCNRQQKQGGKNEEAVITGCVPFRSRILRLGWRYR